MKREFLAFLIDAKNQGKRIAAYSAPAKGNTLLKDAGVRTDFIDFTVDRNPHKQGTYLPGTQIPIVSPGEIFRSRPDDLLTCRGTCAKRSCSRWKGSAHGRPIPGADP